MKGFFRIAKELNVFGDYYSLMRYPAKGGEAENMGDFVTLEEAEWEKKYLEDNYDEKSDSLS